jgi:hypothetical protein
MGKQGGCGQGAGAAPALPSRPPGDADSAIPARLLMDLGNVLGSEILVHVGDHPGLLRLGLILSMRLSRPDADEANAAIWAAGGLRFRLAVLGVHVPAARGTRTGQSRRCGHGLNPLLLSCPFI